MENSETDYSSFSASPVPLPPFDYESHKTVNKQWGWVEKPGYNIFPFTLEPFQFTKTVSVSIIYRYDFKLGSYSLWFGVYWNRVTSTVYHGRFNVRVYTPICKRSLDGDGRFPSGWLSRVEAGREVLGSTRNRWGRGHGSGTGRGSRSRISILKPLYSNSPLWGGILIRLDRRERTDNQERLSYLSKDSFFSRRTLLEQE